MLERCDSLNPPIRPAGHFLIKTLGCKANLYDSQLIEAELRKRGWRAWEKSVAAEGEDLLCIVNSCTVTDEADRQSRKLASRLSREHPRSTVVVTGCAAEVDPERLARSKGVNYVVGNRDKPQLVELILRRLNETASTRDEEGEILGQASGYREIASRHPQDREWYEPEDGFFTPPVGTSAEISQQINMTRAFLKIQEGCNSFCTYCIIPYGRGPSRSLRPREVIAQIRELVSRGVRETVLTGTNIGDYGTDWGGSEAPGEGLAALLEMILGETALERLRISSLDPTEISPRTRELLRKNPRLCPHFHVSLQSASDRVLKLMKRPYGLEQIEHCLHAIAELPGDCHIGMDVITGFPGETPEEFQGTYEALERLPWSRLHVFPYSERAGTPATRIAGSVPMSERSQRARRLMDLSLRRLRSKYEAVLARSQAEPGQLLEGILLERAGQGPERAPGEWLAGYTPNYLRVFVQKTPALARNQLVSARVHSYFLDAASGDAAFVASEALNHRDTSLPVRMISALSSE